MRCVCHSTECQATWTQQHCDCSTYLGTQCADYGYMATWSVNVKEPKNILNEPRACVRSLIENEYYYFFYVFVLMKFSILFAVFGSEMKCISSVVVFLRKLLGNRARERRAQTCAISRVFESYRSICCRGFAVIVLILDFCGRRTIFRIECLGHFRWQRGACTWCNSNRQLTPRVVSAFTDTWVGTMRQRNRCAANAFDSEELS